MWQNTRRYSATSVYFSTSPLALPGCSLSSHPKSCRVSRRASRLILCTTHPTPSIIGSAQGNAMASPPNRSHFVSNKAMSLTELILSPRRTVVLSARSRSHCAIHNAGACRSYVAHALPITLSAISRHAKTAAAKSHRSYRVPGPCEGFISLAGLFVSCPPPTRGTPLRESILFRSMPFLFGLCL